MIQDPRQAGPEGSKNDAGPNVMIQDPRLTVKVLGFYYPDREEQCDVLCGVGFLGNFWKLKQPIKITATAQGKQPREHSFQNAEAAFQALKFWKSAEAFERVTGDEAFSLKKKFAGKEDFTYGGTGSNWKGMRTVLEAKFAPNSELANKLVGTGDAYFLEHNSVPNRDKIWSDNYDGEGTNWLGLQLMHLRGVLGGDKTWQTWIEGLIDMNTGQELTAGLEEHWRNSVRAARNALMARLEQHTQVCERPGCGKPSFNGRPGEYCSKSCRQSTQGNNAYVSSGPPMTAAVCLRPGCGKPTYNGQPNEYCSRSCRQSMPQLNATSYGSYGSYWSPNTQPVCIRPGCGKPTYNGKPFEVCSQSCWNRLGSMTTMYPQDPVQKKFSGSGHHTSGIQVKSSQPPTTGLLRGDVVTEDPRNPSSMEVLAFHYPDKKEPCDHLCEVAFLGNFWPLQKPLVMTAKFSGQSAIRDWCKVNDLPELLVTKLEN